MIKVKTREIIKSTRKIVKSTRDLMSQTQNLCTKQYFRRKRNTAGALGISKTKKICIGHLTALVS